jgi:hypothetical protein
MQRDAVTKFTLAMIAIFLALIALRPIFTPPPAQAQSANAYPFYIEPGYQMLRAPDGSRQVYGKVVVDLRNGKIWDFRRWQTNPIPLTTSVRHLRRLIHLCSVPSLLPIPKSSAPASRRKRI